MHQPGYTLHPTGKGVMQYATQPSACGARLAGASKAGGKRKGAARDRATRPSIVITELPYQTNKANFVAGIADLVEDQKLTGVSHLLPAWLAM